MAEGKQAVAPLIKALSCPRGPYVRWEAAKALGRICDPRAAGPLVAALEDEDEGVRWAAADALIALKCQCLAILLSAMIERSYSFWLLQGVRHICHAWVKRDYFPRLVPLLEAFEHPEPELAVPLVASALAHEFRL